jgi:hypothetical protein
MLRMYDFHVADVVFGCRKLRTDRPDAYAHNKRPGAGNSLLHHLVKVCREIGGTPYHPRQVASC